MKYLIKIDRASIKKNPNAGNRTYLYSLGHHWEVDKERVYEDLNMEQVKEFLKAGKTVTRVENVQQLHTISPAPDYFYNYLPQDIECEYCGAKFNWDKLEDDYDQDFYCKESCPKCQIGECCKIEFEKFDKNMFTEGENVTT